MRHPTARSAERPRDADTTASAPPRAISAIGPAAVLALQRSCGNAAVTAPLARTPATEVVPYGAKPKPQDGLIDSGAAARLVTGGVPRCGVGRARDPEARADVLVRVAAQARNSGP